MSLKMFVTGILFLIACIPLITFTAGVIIRIYFKEKAGFYAQVANAANAVVDNVGDKIKEKKNDGEQ